MITSFRGYYHYLSNFYPMDILYEGEVYRSVEHAFQAAKCSNKCDQKEIRTAKTPGKAKFIGKRVSLRHDWEAEKTSIMENLLRKKFRHPMMKKLLKKTMNQKIIEVNEWHDVYWGVCSCVKHRGTGQNVLGTLLMKLRAEM